MKRKVMAMKWLRELDNTEAPSVTQPRLKRVKVSDPEPVEEPGNLKGLKGLWKATPPVGTPKFILDSPLYNSFNWDFSNLEQAFQEGGKLHDSGSKVYLFSHTEVATVEQTQVVIIPVVVAVVSDSPPSDHLGLQESEEEVEKVIPMKRLKMDWVPYEVPNLDREDGPDIFVLSSTQRRAAVEHKHVKWNGDNLMKKFEYALPYLSPKARIMCHEVDDSDEEEEFFSANSEELEELCISVDEDDDDDHKKNVNVELEEEKSGSRSLEKVRIYKFYPVQTQQTPDISEKKIAFVNRYYGKAHEIF